MCGYSNPVDLPVLELRSNAYRCHGCEYLVDGNEYLTEGFCEECWREVLIEREVFRDQQFDMEFERRYGYRTH